MKLEGEHVLPGRPEALWDLLLDPDILVAAIPGCERFEKVSDDVFRGVITAKIGSIQSTYTTTFTISDRQFPHSYRLHIKGQGPGGFVQGTVRMELVANGPETTRMRHEGEATVGGKIARVGQRMLDAAAGMIVEKGFKDLSARVEQELAPARPAGPPEGDAPRGTTGGILRALGATLKSFGRVVWARLRTLRR